MEEALKELRPDPQKTGIRPHFARLRREYGIFGTDRLQTIVREQRGYDIASGLFFPRSGIEDFREFQYSQIPGKVFVFLPLLSSMPPERSLKATNGR